METFTSFPQPNSGGATSSSSSSDNCYTNRDQQDPTSCLTLSQFDDELQQQAQLAMRQDFENYLPQYNNSNTMHILHQLHSPPSIAASDMSRQSSASSCEGKTVDEIIGGTPINNLLSTTQEEIPNCPIPQPNNIWCINNSSTTPSIEYTTSLLEQQVPSFAPTTDITANITFPLNYTSCSFFGSPDLMLHTIDTFLSFHPSPDQMLNNDKSFPTPPTPNKNMNTLLETPLQSPGGDNISLTPPPTVNFSNIPYAQGITDEKKPNIISTKSSSSLPLKHKKITHSGFERRYCNNINDRITELKNVVPAIYVKIKDTTTIRKRAAPPSAADNEEEDGKEYLDDVAVATNLNKATILDKATEYILYLKRTGDDVRLEHATLQHLLAQLTGGQEVLVRYQMQYLQREQKLGRQQRGQERNVQQKQHLRQQREKETSDSGRKKARVTTSSSPVAESDLYTTAPDFQQPRLQQIPVTHRVFMAMFMAISFFSSSRLSAGPTSKEQFEYHNHISRTSDDELADLASNSTSSYILSSLFPISDTWFLIRSTVFLMCLVQLFSPILKYWSYNLIKVKKVGRKYNSITGTPIKSNLNGNISTHTTTSLTPGDQKCMQIYSILVKSLENDTPHDPSKSTVYPQRYYSTLGLYLALLKEMARFVSRHWLGYEILYNDQQDDLTPQEQWVQACKWIKLNEVECLGGNPYVTPASMLYSCFHLLNMMELLQDDEHEFVEQSRSRVYATTALQMALLIPHHGISNKFSKYFWRLAMYESGLEDDALMRALIFDCHEDNGEDRMEVMLTSRAWYETVQVMNHQIEYFRHQQVTGGLSLSMTAPVLVPVGILSTLHLLDNLQTQFGRLIISVTAKPSLSSFNEEGDHYDFYETAFAQLLDITDPESDMHECVDDYHRLAHWLATVGAMVEALWRSDNKTAERLIKTLVKKVPRSLISSREEEEISSSSTDDEALLRHKERMNQLDELTKKSIIHTLVGAFLLKKKTSQHYPDQRHLGVEELWKAEHAKTLIKRIIMPSSSGGTTHKKNRRHKKILQQDLESSVLSLAEFVTAITGLEAWITAWGLVSILAPPDQHEVWESTMIEQVRHASLHVRRMVRRQSLDRLSTNQTIVERLSRLGAYVSSSQMDSVDSACDCSSSDFVVGEAYNEDLLEEDQGRSIVRRSQKAIKILRGLS